MRIPLFVAACLSTLSACGSSGPAGVGVAPAPRQPGAPLESREPHGALHGLKPAFSGQTRAAGVDSRVPLQVTVVASSLTLPWSVEPLPDGRLLVSEKPGRLLVIAADGSTSRSVDGLPAVHFSGQAGLHDIALAPDFASSRTIYFTYAESRPGGSGTALARAVLVEDARGIRLDGVAVIFRQMPVIESERQYGSRVVFAPDGKLFLALGERGVEGAVGQAQDLRSDFGKVVRLNPDGSIPRDNPLVGRADAWPQIWSWGHRDIQSAAIDPVTGELWTVDHGPRGGDELNHTRAGRNYGWPVITYGIDYPGTKIGAGITQQTGMEQPVYYWDPVIAPSGMLIYSGAMFPEWQGSVFVGGLAGMKLVRLQLADGRVTGEEWLLQDRARRIRDVQQGPGGEIYVLTDSGNQSELLRLTRAP